MEVAGEMRFRPEIALTRLQFAELLLEHYPEDLAEALEHVNFAILVSPWGLHRSARV